MLGRATQLNLNENENHILLRLEYKNISHLQQLFWLKIGSINVLHNLIANQFSYQS